MNIRLTILLVFVLALFGALALWFKPWEQDTPREDEPWAWRIDDDAIVHVEVTHRGPAGESLECSNERVPLTGEEQSIVYDKDLGRGRWFIVEGDERSEVYHQQWAGTPLLLSGPKVDRVLGATIENPAQYGLEPPESVIKITEETGLSYEFWLGNKTPDEGYNYMSVAGSSQLFTVPEVWARVVNCLVVNPPFIPPPLELGYFYEADFRDIQQLEITHDGATVSYAPEPGKRTWYVTQGDDRAEVAFPEWWASQLQWFGQPGKPGGPDNPGGWHVEEEGASDPEYGLQPPETLVRVITHEKTHEFYIGTGHIEVDSDGQPILDDQGNTQVLVHYAGLPDDPIVYVVNRVRAERTICLVTNPPVSAPYRCEPPPTQIRYSEPTSAPTIPPPTQRHPQKGYWYPSNYAGPIERAAQSFEKAVRANNVQWTCEFMLQSVRTGAARDLELAIIDICYVNGKLWRDPTGVATDGCSSAASGCVWREVR